MSNDKKTRTIPQNKSLHKWCELVAIAFNDAGLDMKHVLFGKVERKVMLYVDEHCIEHFDNIQAIFDEHLSKFDLPWTKDSVKESMWKPVQKAMLDKESTTEMDTCDPSTICDVLNRHFSETYGIYVPWPSHRG